MITLNGTSGIVNDATDLNYTGTLTGGMGVVNLGSGQVVKGASGNVGIGTSTPSTPLEIGRTIDNNQIRLKASNGNVDLRVNSGFAGADVAAIGNVTAHPLTFFTGNIERARIDASGNLLVGTNTSTGELVQFVGTAGSGTMKVQVGANGNNGIGFRNVSGTGVGSIAVNASSTAYNTSSDYRLKEAVEPMQGALARNALLNPVKYKWKADGSDGEGFIAHELQTAFPAAVTGEKDAVDAEGKPVYQGIGTGPLDGHFAACVNELNQMIQELKAIVDAQAVEIAALKGAA